MSIVVRAAKTQAQRDAIYRFRYDVYVEEMGRYRTIADHEKCLLVEPEDTRSRLFYAAGDDGKVVGTMRVTWGGDTPFNRRMIEQYDLEPFLESVPRDQVIVGERFMVARTHRGSDLIFQLFRTYMHLVNENRVQLIFGDCEPHLLNLYLGLGFRTYTRKNVNSKETGYLVPLLMVAEDMEYFRAVNSPLVDVLKDFGDDRRTPECLERVLAAGSAVKSEKLSEPGSYSREILMALNQLTARRPLLFDGMSDAQAALCLSKSNVIECRAGDRLIKRGNTAKNLYVALAGTLEVRDANDVVGVITAGDVFGEMAFLLNAPRSMDVYAATDHVKVLSLSESKVRGIMKSDPECAAVLLLNISKMLCLKLLNRPGRSS